MNSSSPRWTATRVLLLGRQAIVLAGLRLLIESDPRFTVVDASSPTSGAPLPAADVIVLDVDGEGADLLGDVLSDMRPGGRLVVMGSELDQRLLTVAFQQGVTGAIRKQEPPEVLLDALENVARGQMWLDRAATSELVLGLSSGPVSTTRETRQLERLTARERDVVSLVSEGLRNLAIAERLQISEVTVRNHLTSIFRKLEVSSRFQLALYAFKYGLGRPPRSPKPARSAARAAASRRKKST